MINNQDCEFFCGSCFTGNTPTVFLRDTDADGFNVYQCTQCHSYRREETCTDFTSLGDTIQMDGPVTQRITVMTQAAWDETLRAAINKFIPNKPV